MIRKFIIGVFLFSAVGSFGQRNPNDEMRNRLSPFIGHKFEDALMFIQSQLSGTDWAPIAGMSENYSGVMVWTDDWNIYAKFDKAFYASAWASPHQRSLSRTVSSFTVVRK